ncbi:hypothetical protein DAPPUDRAFT_246668 [Daphnia pulex]|uniref:Uncharacterized protein n=1 Tax=Daphnia pulex TaxID=6669 RepID=E9GR12_DAPPU|nr:hypothetical protein DAPPUDRAFT_246668 [Daphnia pulex]|eukprot:EFX78074.1 hypothetical protein DAPPUDRAFT_246668 [Daphnia pulex]
MLFHFSGGVEELLAGNGEFCKHVQTKSKSLCPITYTTSSPLTFPSTPINATLASARNPPIGHHDA